MAFSGNHCLLSDSASYRQSSIPMLCRVVYGADNDLEREVRISCPDATGLGCDVTRMLLDFGLRIVHGDMSTDGKWCFLIFRVSSLICALTQMHSCVTISCGLCAVFMVSHNSGAHDLADCSASA